MTKRTKPNKIKDPATLPEGRHGFGENLWLSVEGASRSWSFRFKLPGQKPRTMGLGGWPVVSLEAARQAALDAKRLTRPASIRSSTARRRRPAKASRRPSRASRRR